MHTSDRSGFLSYFNPVEHFGDKRYSIVFPLLATLLICVLCEFYAEVVRQDPMAVGQYVIYVSFATVIYFSIRSGISGGIISTLVIIAYYLYIIYSRNYSGTQYTAGIQATVIFGIVFALASFVIGFLKEKVDTLIERESDERQRLQSIIDQLPVGVVVTDLQGNIEQGNKQLRAILGRDIDFGAVAGRDTLENARHAATETTVSPQQWPLAQTLATGKSVTDKEFLLYRDDTKDSYISVSSALIRNVDGKPIAAASILSDITTQKELESRKDDFINMASHELKTPLTSLKLYVDSLYMKLKTSKQRPLIKTVKTVQFQIEKLNDLVADLLDVSRIQTGKIHFEKTQFPLEEVIGSTVRDLSEVSSKHHLIFRTKTHVKVTADRFRIAQVLTNLITNAMKYSPEGGDIRIDLKVSDGNAVVSVRDSGIGIAKKHQTRIFERLYQVTDPNEKTYPGLGLGLYISREIIRRHRGKIWVESEKGAGSTFYFSLPRSGKH